jgi:hypothetical protein
VVSFRPIAATILSHLLSVLHQTGANTLDGASYTYDPAGDCTAKTNDLRRDYVELHLTRSTS